MLSLICGLILFAGVGGAPDGNAASEDMAHVLSRDLALIPDAFLHGYTHNLVNERVGDRKMLTLTVGCTWDGKHASDCTPDRAFFSVWTRDLYWGFLGWAQAGDDSVLDVMRSSIELLVLAKNRNQALGQSEHWPASDERFYVPQAFTTGLKPAMNFMPYNAESQAHFVLMSRDYWRLTGDIDFIRSIWPDICYVAKTLELLDTDGNALPDNSYGSYDYQGIAPGMEEPMLCAATYAAYLAVAELAQALEKQVVSDRMMQLADRLRTSMNKPVEIGGLWKPLENGDGYFVNFRVITAGQERIDARFIPYENLCPMFFGVTTPEQDVAIFNVLDGDYEMYYGTKYGPMYVALAGHNDKSEVGYTSAPWLGFLDVYLRCRKNHAPNRDRIFKALIDHAYDVPGACFTEGLGIFGYLSGVSGRSWDNGNFFHALVTSVYGIEKSRDGIRIRPPVRMESQPVTELRNVRWREAVYDFRWEGSGNRIAAIKVDGTDRLAGAQQPDGESLLTETSGKHDVVITLAD